jgi:hypothetical protein
VGFLQRIMSIPVGVEATILTELDARFDRCPTLASIGVSRYLGLLSAGSHLGLSFRQGDLVFQIFFAIGLCVVGQRVAVLVGFELTRERHQQH